MAGNTLDDLLRAADKGVPIGTTQRYFKGAPQPAPTPQPAPAPAPAPQPSAPAESEKEIIDRIMGRRQPSMSDAPGGLAAGQRYAMADTAAAEPAPDRKATLARVRSMYPMYKDMSDDELGVALAQKYEQYKFLAPVVAPSEPGAARDTVSGPSSPNQVLASVLNPGQPGPLNMAQRVGNAVLPPLVTAPAIAAGGELLPAAPAIGRALASGAVGGAKALSQGKSAGGVAWDAVVDTLLGGASEGAAGLATRLKIPFTGMPSLKEAGEKVPRAAAGYAGAGKAIDKASDMIAARLPKGAWLNLPAIDSSKRLTLDEAVKALKEMKGAEYEVARKQLIYQLNAADQAMVKGGVKPLTKPYSGQIFGQVSPKERFTYRGTPGERAATKALDLSRNPMGRAALDAEATDESVVPGVPNALLPILGLEGSTFGELARHARPRL